MTELISASPAFFQSGFFLQQSDKNNKSKDFVSRSSSFWWSTEQFFMNSSQYKNANTVNFVLAVPLGIN